MIRLVVRSKVLSDKFCTPLVCDDSPLARRAMFEALSALAYERISTRHKADLREGFDWDINQRKLAIAHACVDGEILPPKNFFPRRGGGAGMCVAFTVADIVCALDWQPDPELEEQMYCGQYKIAPLPDFVATTKKFLVGKPVGRWSRGIFGR